MIVVSAVTLLVWDSHHKAFYAQQLSQFKDEESLLLMHLQIIEQQSLHLSRLAQSGVRNNNSNNDGEEAVDFDLIHKQTEQLHFMEEAIYHALLQTRIQQSARNHIIEKFGEGPVDVVLKLDFSQMDQGNIGHDTITVRLWNDTPHAAWTWLEQIERNVWEGAQFTWQQGQIIDVIPQKEDPAGSKIEFIEQSQHGHEALTVGLRESETGEMSMYVNLQDNSSIHKHETCVGKVNDGFDTLQRVLESSRNAQSHNDSPPVIPIKRVTAMHVTQKEGKI